MIRERQEPNLQPWYRYALSTVLCDLPSAGRNCAAGLAGALLCQCAIVPELVCATAQGLYRFHQYQVVGRHLPSDKDPEPTIYRMKLWATDPVRAKSKFWYVQHHRLVYPEQTQL